MLFYFLLLRIAAIFNTKARLLVRGQAETLGRLSKEISQGDHYIWIHVASVGEFEQARPIICRLRSEHYDKKILLTFFSPSGYELLKDYDGVDNVVYLPFATRWNARRFLNIVKPELAIFVKYEFWPAYLRTLKKRKIRTYLVSAIFRPSQLFFRWFGGPYRRLLKNFTMLFVQDRDSRHLLEQYGIRNVLVTGDTRFDRVYEIAQDDKNIPLVEQFARDMPQVIVAGSTWLPDEQFLARYIDSHPMVRLILAPHELSADRMWDVFHLFHGRYVRLSEATENSVSHCQTLLVDQMGILSKLYRYGQVAYVGGGFGVGIHNTIEAAVYGMPVVFGPKYKHFREARELIRQNAGFSVKTYEDFEQVMDKLLDDPKEAGTNAMDLIRAEIGATDRIYRAIFCKNEEKIITE